MAKQVEEPIKSVEAKEKVVETHKHQSPLWWVLGTLLAVVVLIFVLGAVKHAVSDKNDDGFKRAGFGRMMDGDRHSMRGSRDSNSDNRLSGVVTAIDGSSITIAGNGTTKKVTINDTTEYYGAAQPVKVNDTVRIKGTTNGDTFTASQILISRSSAE